MSGPLISAVPAISAEEFARWLKDFMPLSDKVAVAVSGGPDSMALAYCLKHLAGLRCVAFIVDHGLRAESTQEAEQVKTRLIKLGLEAEILHWQHKDITARLHEKARVARYQLLTDACRQANICDLFTAHHRDDQAETILMRVAKGSGVEGLGGISAETVRDNVRLLRPFLGTPKLRLIETCRAAHLDFVSDPSNNSKKFARGRLRGIMPLLADEGLTTDNLVRLGKRAKEANDALSLMTREFLKGATEIQLGGSIRLKRESLLLTPRAIALRAMSDCLRYIHPADYPPEYDGLSDLFDEILTLDTDTARTFYGTILSVTRNTITILREPAAAKEILPFPGRPPVLWDKRWLISSSNTAPQGSLQALGTAPHALIDSLAPSLRHQIPQGRVRASLPALWIDGKITAIPDFSEKSAFHLAFHKRTFP